MTQTQLEDHDTGPDADRGRLPVTTEQAALIKTPALERRRLLNILKYHHRGRDNAISSSALGDFIHRASTTVRDRIQYLVVEHGALIASCSDGYYWIDSKHELQEELNRLESQIDAAKARQSAMAATWYGEHDTDNDA